MHFVCVCRIAVHYLLFLFILVVGSAFPVDSLGRSPTSWVSHVYDSSGSIIDSGIHYVQDNF